MNNWKDSDRWSSWVCATCYAEQNDPDTVMVTTCGKGHTNYLEPVLGDANHRRAFATAKERRDTLREEHHIRQLFLSAFKKSVAATEALKQRK